MLDHLFGKTPYQLLWKGAVIEGDNTLADLGIMSHSVIRIWFYEYDEYNGDSDYIAVVHKPLDPNKSGCHDDGVCDC